MTLFLLLIVEDIYEKRGKILFLIFCYIVYFVIYKKIVKMRVFVEKNELF